jgi:hypothetical protein
MAEDSTTDAPFVTFEFGMVVDREQVTVTFPGMDAKWHFVAQAPDAQGTKRIQAAPFRLRDGDNAGDGPELTPNAYAAYLAKCEAQIVDFCWPKLDRNRRLVGEQHFDHKFPGRNREAYNSLGPKTMNFVEGALDRIAGRETTLAEEYDALLLGSAPSASTG